jgi:hypothetical protein
VHALRLLRLANPVVRAALGSRLHPLLSGRLVVVTYRGRRTGRMFAIPLRYAKGEGGGLVAIAVRPSEKLWWRAFAEPAPASVTLRGATVAVTGRLTAGEGRDEALAAYVTRFPRSAKLAQDAAIVVFTLAR